MVQKYPSYGCFCMPFHQPHPSTHSLLCIGTNCSVPLEEQFRNKKVKNPKVLALVTSFCCDLASKIVVGHIRIYLAVYPAFKLLFCSLSLDSHISPPFLPTLLSSSTVSICFQTPTCQAVLEFREKKKMETLLLLLRVIQDQEGELRQQMNFTNDQPIEFC